MNLLELIALVITVILAAYWVTALTIQTALLTSAALELRSQVYRTRGERRHVLLASEATPTISVVAPAYNEALSIEQSVRSLLTLQYPKLQIVVVNDGSLDDTLGVLRRVFKLRRIRPIFRQSVPTAPIRGIYASDLTLSLLVVDKANGGKSDALNAGLNIITSELVCAVDADTIINNDALLRLVRPFMTDEGVLGTGGSVRVVNGCRVRTGRVIRVGAPRSWLAGIQVVEYLRAFTFGRLGWNRLGGNLIVSGAFGLFRREQVLSAGGYLEGSVGEDMELVVRLRRQARERGEPDGVPFVPDAVAWTEVPEGLRMLARQRDRWQRGLAEVMFANIRTVFNPRYGQLGLMVMPAFLLLDLLGPLIELVAILVIVFGLVTALVDPEFLILILLLGYATSIPLSLTAVVMDQLGYRTYRTWGDRARLVAWAFLENIGYRQFMTMIRIRAMVRFTLGARGWGEMTRKGFATEATGADAAFPGAPAAGSSDETGTVSGRGRS